MKIAGVSKEKVRGRVLWRSKNKGGWPHVVASEGRSERKRIIIIMSMDL